MSFVSQSSKYKTNTFFPQMDHDFGYIVREEVVGVDGGAGGDAVGQAIQEAIRMLEEVGEVSLEIH